MRLTDKKAALVRSALAEYSKSVSEKAHRICGSYSEEAIAVCCLRLELENLLAELDRGRLVLTVANASSMAPLRGHPVVDETHGYANLMG